MVAVTIAGAAAVTVVLDKVKAIDAVPTGGMLVATTWKPIVPETVAPSSVTLATTKSAPFDADDAGDS